jgi:hypothetical protein
VFNSEDVEKLFKYFKEIPEPYRVPWGRDNTKSVYITDAKKVIGVDDSVNIGKCKKQFKKLCEAISKHTNENWDYDVKYPFVWFYRIVRKYNPPDNRTEYNMASMYPPPSKPSKGNIYLISAGEHVKIGVAKDVKKRLAGLQTGNPVQLEVLTSYAPKVDPYLLEKLLHEHFKDIRMSGEWFKNVFSVEEFLTLCQTFDKK